MLKKLFIIWINPLIIIAAGVLSWPTLKANILKERPYLEIPIACFVIGSTVLIYFFNVLLPYLKVIKVNSYRKKWKNFAAVVTNIKEHYPDYGLVINIMVPKYKLWHKLEPISKTNLEKKLIICGRIFKIAWHSGTLAHKKFSMSVNQGFAGEAFAAGPCAKDVCSGPLATGSLSNYDHKFTPEQQKLLDDLFVVFSYAIADEDDENKSKGVVNVESRNPTSLEIFAEGNEGKLASLSSSVKLLAFMAKGKV